jgi:[ribosomal protein S5]-alanine N-acetyltransferase
MPRLEAPQHVGVGGITLRQWRSDDALVLRTMAQDPSIQKFTTIPRFTTGHEWSAWIAARSEDAVAGRALFLAVELGDEPVGSVNVIRLDAVHRKAELGYWLAAPHRGKGLMTTALAQMSRWCLEAYDLIRLELLVPPENEPSLRVAQRVGYTCEGLLRAFRFHEGQPLDLFCLSLLPEDTVK